VSVAFLKAYRATMDQAQLLPRGQEEFQMLLDVFLLEKAIYEVGYEMAHRPHWLSIPLAGVLGLLEAADGAGA